MIALPQDDLQHKGRGGCAPEETARWVQEATHLWWDARTYHASVLYAFELTLSCFFQIVFISYR